MKTVETTKRDLLDALIAVKPGIAKKEIFEQATHFIFSGDTVMTYNERVCVQFPFNTPFSCSVVSEDLYRIVSGLKSSETIKMFHSEDHLNIVTKTTEASLNTAVESREAEELIAALGQQDLVESMKKIPKTFMKGIDLCRFNCSKTSTSMNYHCICIDNGYMYTCDDWRLTRFKLSKGMGSKRILLPASAANELSKYEVLEYIVHSGWIHFLCGGGAIFSAVTASGDFENVEDIIDQVDSGNKVSLPDELQSALSMVSVLSEGDKDDEKEVLLEIGKSEIICSAKHKERGTVKRKVGFSGTKKEFSFSINPSFLGQVLSMVSDVEVTTNVAKFESDNFVHIITVEDEEFEDDDDD